MGCAVCAILRDGKKGEFILKQTENYQLNQWEKPDRIMMEDFNADNAKLDAVIKSETHRIEHMPHGVLLCGGVAETAVPRIDLDVSQVDWNWYVLCFLRVQMPTFRSTFLQMNRGDRAYYLSTNASSNNITNHLSSSKTACTIIPVLYDGSRPFLAVTLSEKSTISTHSQPLNNGAPITLRYADNDANKDPLPVGTLFELWGVR